MKPNCDYCRNKENCNECNKEWADKFVPLEEVRDFFRKVYVGVRGINGYQYTFDTVNESLVSTHSICIDGDYYCPYCGERMYLIQDNQTLDVIGHCCICNGARDEIKFEKEKVELEKKYKEELCALENKYKDSLAFCTDKLFEIKQKRERKRFNIFSHKYNHFSTTKGELLHDIDQIVK